MITADDLRYIQSCLTIVSVYQGFTDSIDEGIFEEADNFPFEEEPGLQPLWHRLKALVKIDPEFYLKVTRVLPNQIREKMHSYLIPNYKNLMKKGLKSNSPVLYRALKFALTPEQWVSLGGRFLLEDRPLVESIECSSSVICIYHSLTRTLSDDQWVTLQYHLADHNGRGDEGYDAGSYDDIIDYFFEDFSRQNNLYYRGE